ncbi:hypothetical protein HC928_06025 [bacterium]|nr:hypothetical protein [bacterium]
MTKFTFQRKNKVASKVLGIGLSKTGTTSLCTALNLLGIPTIHLPPNLEIIEHFDGAVDITVAVAYRFLDRRYPGAKFILTVRELESWLRSSQSQQERAIVMNQGNVPKWIEAAVRQCYGQWQFDSVLWRTTYERHLAEVKEYFRGRESDLLVLDICGGQGWQELHSFLNCEVPLIPFPHEHRTPLGEALRA